MVAVVAEAVIVRVLVLVEQVVVALEELQVQQVQQVQQTQVAAAALVEPA